MSLVDGKQILVNILERDVGNLYSSLYDAVLNSLNGQPLVKKMVENYISANQDKWISKLEEQIQIIADASFPTAETTLEEAVVNANDLANVSISQFLESKFNLSLDSVNVVLNVLFGSKL